jgi:general secretion pathway protein F
LADALAEHPAVFPDLYVGMVRAGEAAGALDLVLDRLATYTESQSRLATRVRAALSYPILMSAVSAGIVTFLLAFVVPKVTKIFTEQKQELPVPTRILLGISNGVAASWWFLLLLLVAAGFALNGALRRPASRLWFDPKLLALPIAEPRHAGSRWRASLAPGTLIGGIPLSPRST